MEKMKLNIQMFASNGCTVTVVSCTPSSASDNYSTIKIHGKLTTGSSSYNYGGAYMEPTISNQPVVGSQTASQTLSKKKYSIGTNGTKEDDWTFKVYHNDDGTCNNLTIKIKWYISNSTNGTATLSGGYTPATIARASSLAATDGTLNSSNSVSITITRKNNTFTHTLRYECGTASGWIKDSNNKVATSATWTPPLSLASQNQSESSVSCRIYCQTYDGNNTVGSEAYKDITLTIPTLNPTASLSSISDSTSYKNTYGVFIQNKSKISATLSGTAQYSTINTYNWEIRQTNSSGSILASGSSTSISYTPTTSGTLYIKGTVKDKRGAQNSTSTTVSITAYNTPKCNLAVSRTGDTTASYTMSGSGSPISQSGYTANTVTYLLKRGSTQIRSTSNGASYTGTDSGITANDSYTYTLTATDTISGTTDTKTVSISTTFTLMNFNSTGYAMAIGKASEATGTTKLLEIAVPTMHSEDIYFKELDMFNDTSGSDWQAMMKNKIDYCVNNINTSKERTSAFINGGWSGVNYGFGIFSKIGTVYQLKWFSSNSTYYVRKIGDSYSYYNENNVDFFKANSIEATNGIYSKATGNVGTPTGGSNLVIKRANNSEAPNNGVVLEFGNSTNWVGQLYIGDNATQGVYYNGWSNGVRGSWRKLAWEPVSLYDDSSGTTGTVTLSESSANFAYLEILYSYYAGGIDAYHSVKIYSPNGKVALLIGSYDNGTRLYHEVARYTISGTSITRSNAARWRFGVGENSTRTNTTTGDPSIKVVKVIGYR